MVVASPATPCLRCVFPLPPDPRTLGTCDTVGVLGPAANAIGALQAIAVIKLLCAPGQASRELLGIDFWTGRFTNVSLRDARREDCVCCSQRRFEFLDDRQAGASAVQLCGCDTVQVRPAGTGELDLDAVAKRLADAGVVRRTPYFVRCALYQPGGVVLTLFRDRRLLVQGGADVNRAKSFYARFVGE